MHIKKSVEPSSSSVLLRSWTTFTTQLQRIKPTLNSGSAVACLGGDLKVSKFQKYQISYFAFSYSMMCILNYALCFIGNSIRLYSVEINCKSTIIIWIGKNYFVVSWKVCIFATCNSN